MKRIVTWISMLLLAAGLLGGCASKTAAREGESLPQIIVGSDSYPPYVYLDNNGDPIGIDVDIAEEAFRRMGYQAVFKTIDWEQKNNLLESGEIDCVWGCFSMAGREQQYQWAGPYMLSRQVIAVNANSGIYTWDDLAGKTVAVQSTGKPEELFLSGKYSGFPDFAEVISVEERDVQYAALDCGYVDAIAAHEIAIRQYIEDYETNFRVLEKPVLVTGIGVAFDKQDERGLAQQLTDVFKQMRQDGTMKEIVGRYLDDPETFLEVNELEQ